MKLSIIIPVFNEEKTIGEVIKRISQIALPTEKEVIIIDDGSQDKSKQVLEELKKRFSFILLSHKRNRGKGSAIQTGIKVATGDIILIQDADLEYDINDYPFLISPFLESGAEIVYGSRNLKKNDISSIGFYLGGRGLTLFFNILFRAHLTDINTCYKVFKSRIIKDEIKLKENNFNFCEEVTAKVIKRGYKIIEVPINYHPRKKSEGKKIYWMDGLKGVWAILKYRLRD